MTDLARAIHFGLDAENAPKTRWLWHGLLAAGKLTLLTGLWKSGKTTLLAHLLARRRPPDSSGQEPAPPTDFLGLAVAPGVSLVVSEEPRDLWHERCRRHRLGAEVGVLSRPFAGRPTLAQIEQLNSHLIDLQHERGLDLVIFDSLAMFLPAHSENSAGVIVDALAPFVDLAEAGLAVGLLITRPRASRRSARPPAAPAPCSPAWISSSRCATPPAIPSAAAASSSPGRATTRRRARC